MFEHLGLTTAHESVQGAH